MYTTYVLMIIYVQILASYVNGEWHYTPFGMFRRNNSAVYTVFVEYYGFEKGTRIYNQYLSASNLLVGYPRYKLVVLMMKIVLNFMQKNEKQMKALSEKKILIDTLCLHLEVMARNMGMSGDVKIFEKLLQQDWKRMSSLEIKVDDGLRVEYSTETVNTLDLHQK